MRDLFVIAKVLHLDCTVAFLRIECIYQKPTVGREGLSGDGLPLIKVFIKEIDRFITEEFYYELCGLTEAAILELVILLRL